MMQKKSTTLGLEERTERVLAYMFFWISGIFFLFFEKNRNVRWHALQSTIVFGVLWLCMFAISILKAVLWAVLSLIPILGEVLRSVTSFGLGLIFSILLWITVLLWLWLMLMALLRPNYRLPLPFFGVLLPDFLRK
jgi:uncharacterized membrane protein